MKYLLVRVNFIWEMLPKSEDGLFDLQSTLTGLEIIKTLTSTVVRLSRCFIWSIAQERVTYTYICTIKYSHTKNQQV